MLVRGRRAGWNQRQGQVTDNDILDPPSWVDDGMDEWVQGNLEESTAPASAMYKERKIVTIDGQAVDPETIQPITEP